MATASSTWRLRTIAATSERAVGQWRRHLPACGELCGGKQPYSIAVGDFNGDGIPTWRWQTKARGVVVLLGKGDGTFQSAVNYAAGCSQLHSSWRFQRRRPPDLAVTSCGDDNVSVLLGKGDGTFQAAVNYANRLESVLGCGGGLQRGRQARLDGRKRRWRRINTPEYDGLRGLAECRGTYESGGDGHHRCRLGARSECRERPAHRAGSQRD